MRYNRGMEYGNFKKIETIYYIRVSLQDDQGETILCFLGTDTADRAVEGGSLGKLRLHIFDDDIRSKTVDEEQKFYFFSKAVFFKDKEIAEEILENYIKNIPSNSNKNPPVIEEVERYHNVPLQVMERIGRSDGFIKETVQVGGHTVGYRLTIK